MPKSVPGRKGRLKGNDKIHTEIGLHSPRFFETQVGPVTGMNWHATSQVWQRRGCLSIASVCRSDYREQGRIVLNREQRPIAEYPFPPPNVLISPMKSSYTPDLIAPRKPIRSNAGNRVSGVFFMVSRALKFRIDQQEHSPRGR